MAKASVALSEALRSATRKCESLTPRDERLDARLRLLCSLCDSLSLPEPLSSAAEETHALSSTHVGTNVKEQPNPLQSAQSTAYIAAERAVSEFSSAAELTAQLQTLHAYAEEARRVSLSERDLYSDAIAQKAVALRDALSAADHALLHLSQCVNSVASFAGAQLVCNALDCSSLIGNSVLRDLWRAEVGHTVSLTDKARFIDKFLAKVRSTIDEQRRQRLCDERVSESSCVLLSALVARLWGVADTERTSLTVFDLSSVSDDDEEHMVRKLLLAEDALLKEIAVGAEDDDDNIVREYRVDGGHVCEDTVIERSPFEPLSLRCSLPCLPPSHRPHTTYSVVLSLRKQDDAEIVVPLTRSSAVEEQETPAQWCASSLTQPGDYRVCVQLSEQSDASRSCPHNTQQAGSSNGVDAISPSILPSSKFPSIWERALSFGALDLRCVRKHAQIVLSQLHADLWRAETLTLALTQTESGKERANEIERARRSLTIFERNFAAQRSLFLSHHCGLLPAVRLSISLSPLFAQSALAQRVVLVGSMNDWSMAHATPLYLDADLSENTNTPSYSTTLRLFPGRYLFVFAVNGERYVSEHHHTTLFHGENVNVVDVAYGSTIDVLHDRPLTPSPSLAPSYDPRDALCDDVTQVPYSYTRTPALSSRPEEVLEEVQVDLRLTAHSGACVQVVGSFSHWAIPITMYRVNLPEEDLYSESVPSRVDCCEYAVRLSVRPGVHQCRFLVDGVLRVSDALPKVCDALGNENNVFEVVPSSEHPHATHTTSEERETAADGELAKAPARVMASFFYGPCPVNSQRPQRVLLTVWSVGSAQTQHTERHSLSLSLSHRESVSMSYSAERECYEVSLSLCEDMLYEYVYVVNGSPSLALSPLSHKMHSSPHNNSLTTAHTTAVVAVVCSAESGELRLVHRLRVVRCSATSESVIEKDCVPDTPSHILSKPAYTQERPPVTPVRLLHSLTEETVSPLPLSPSHTPLSQHALYTHNEEDEEDENDTDTNAHALHNERTESSPHTPQSTHTSQTSVTQHTPLRHTRSQIAPTQPPLLTIEFEVTTNVACCPENVRLCSAILAPSGQSMQPAVTHSHKHNNKPSRLSSHHSTPPPNDADVSVDTADDATPSPNGESSVRVQEHVFRTTLVVARGEEVLYWYTVDGRRVVSPDQALCVDTSQRALTTRSLTPLTQAPRVYNYLVCGADAAVTAGFERVINGQRMYAHLFVYTHTHTVPVSVSLTGSFLAWETDPLNTIPLCVKCQPKNTPSEEATTAITNDEEDKEDRVYTCLVFLPIGRHEYNFIVDGVWCVDHTDTHTDTHTTVITRNVHGKPISTNVLYLGISDDVQHDKAENAAYIAESTDLLSLALLSQRTQAALRERLSLSVSDATHAVRDRLMHTLRRLHSLSQQYRPEFFLHDITQDLEGMAVCDIAQWMRTHWPCSLTLSALCERDVWAQLEQADASLTHALLLAVHTLIDLSELLELVYMVKSRCEKRVFEDWPLMSEKKSERLRERERETQHLRALFLTHAQKIEQDLQSVGIEASSGTIMYSVITQDAFQITRDALVLPVSLPAEERNALFIDFCCARLLVLDLTVQETLSQCVCDCERRTLSTLDSHMLTLRKAAREREGQLAMMRSVERESLPHNTNTDTDNEEAQCACSLSDNWLVSAWQSLTQLVSAPAHQTARPHKLTDRQREKALFLLHYQSLRDTCEGTDLSRKSVIPVVERLLQKLRSFSHSLSHTARTESVHLVAFTLAVRDKVVSVEREVSQWLAALRPHNALSQRSTAHSIHTHNNTPLQLVADTITDNHSACCESVLSVSLAGERVWEQYLTAHLHILQSLLCEESESERERLQHFLCDAAHTLFEHERSVREQHTLSHTNNTTCSVCVAETETERVCGRDRETERVSPSLRSMLAAVLYRSQRAHTVHESLRVCAQHLSLSSHNLLPSTPTHTQSWRRAGLSEKDTHTDSPLPHTHTKDELVTEREDATQCSLTQAKNALNEMKETRLSLAVREAVHSCISTQSALSVCLSHHTTIRELLVERESGTTQVSDDDKRQQRVREMLRTFRERDAQLSQWLETMPRLVRALCACVELLRVHDVLSDGARNTLSQWRTRWLALSEEDALQRSLAQINEHTQALALVERVMCDTVRDVSRRLSAMDKEIHKDFHQFIFTLEDGGLEQSACLTMIDDVAVRDVVPHVVQRTFSLFLRMHLWHLVETRCVGDAPRLAAALSLTHALCERVVENVEREGLSRAEAVLALTQAVQNALCDGDEWTSSPESESDAPLTPTHARTHTDSMSALTKELSLTTEGREQRELLQRVVWRQSARLTRTECLTELWLLYDGLCETLSLAHTEPSLPVTLLQRALSEVSRLMQRVLCVPPLCGVSLCDDERTERENPSLTVRVKDTHALAWAHCEGDTVLTHHTTLSPLISSQAPFALTTSLSLSRTQIARAAEHNAHLAVLVHTPSHTLRTYSLVLRNTVGEALTLSLWDESDTQRSHTCVEIPVPSVAPLLTHAPVTLSLAENGRSLGQSPWLQLCVRDE